MLGQTIEPAAATWPEINNPSRQGYYLQSTSKHQGQILQSRIPENTRQKLQVLSVSPDDQLPDVARRFVAGRNKGLVSSGVSSKRPVTYLWSTLEISV